MLLFDLQNEIQPWTKKSTMQLDILSIPWARVSTEDLMPACRTPIQHFVDHYERSRRWSGEWWPAFQHISAWKRWKGENSFYRCVLCYFGTFCKRSFDFFVRFSNGPIALELPSYPNNPNSSNGFSSHLSLIPAWQSTSSCSKQNWKADLKGCFEVRGPNGRGGKALKNGDIKLPVATNQKETKRWIFKSETVFLVLNFQLSRKNREHIPTPAVTQWKEPSNALRRCIPTSRLWGNWGSTKNIAKKRFFHRIVGMFQRILKGCKDKYNVLISYAEVVSLGKPANSTFCFQDNGQRQIGQFFLKNRWKRPMVLWTQNCPWPAGCAANKKLVAFLVQEQCSTSLATQSTSLAAKYATPATPGKATI